MKTIFSLVTWPFMFLVITANAAPTNNASLEKPGKNKPCFQCKGVGRAKCSVPSCERGKANCSAACLKLSDPGWVHLDVAGHPATDLWRKFPRQSGGYSAWNQNHVGELVTFQNGEPVIAKCPTCSGTTKVQCAVCKGSGESVCGLCDGRKVIPELWTAFDNPKMKNRPARFTMKNGQVLLGRKTMVLGSTVTIKTEKGDVTVQASDIVSEQNPSGHR